MQLIILILAAIAGGYLLGRSRYSQNIDEAADKSRGAVSDLWQRWFGRREAAEETAEAEGTAKAK